MIACFRTHVNQVIRGQHDVLIMFHHQNAVTDITEVLQRGDQPLVISLVKTDGRFIQNIGDALQLRADLRGQPDALRFSPTQGSGGPVRVR
jgi:hypothetical protein